MDDNNASLPPDPKIEFAAFLSVLATAATLLVFCHLSIETLAAFGTVVGAIYAVWMHRR